MNHINNLTIASACWKKDYKIILDSPYGEKVFPQITENKLLFINNVNNKKETIKLANEAKNKRLISDYFFTDALCNEVLTFKNWGNITRNSFYAKPDWERYFKSILKGKKFKKSYDGYWFSIAPMCAIYKCQTDWLLYFTGDAYIENDFSWISKACKIMNSDEKYIVACPIWNKNKEEAKKESEGEIDDFWIDAGFSDQCFLINAKRIRNITNVFNERNKFCDKKYMIYAGNCFERRLNAYMRNHGYKRLVYKKSYYVHEDITSEIVDFWMSKR